MKRGGDAKLLAVPADDICPLFEHWKSIADVPEMRLRQIQHFFEHYKDLEAGKWVKVIGWAGVEVAHAEILNGIARYAAEKKTRSLLNRSGRSAVQAAAPASVTHSFQAILR